MLCGVCVHDGRQGVLHGTCTGCKDRAHHNDGVGRQIFGRRHVLMSVVRVQAKIAPMVLPGREEAQTGRRSDKGDTTAHASLTSNAHKT